MLATTESVQKDFTDTRRKKWGSYMVELEGVFREHVVHPLILCREGKNMRSKGPSDWLWLKRWGLCLADPPRP